MQAPLLAIVLLLAITSATLLSTLYLFDRATSTFATREALDTASPESTQLKHTIAVNGPLTDVVDASARAARQGLADTPMTAAVHAEGAIQVLSLDEGYVLTYYASDDRLESLAVLVDGRWPADRAVGATEVAVPRVMLEDLDLAIGDEIEIRARSYAPEPEAIARSIRRVRCGNPTP